MLVVGTVSAVLVMSDHPAAAGGRHPSLGRWLRRPALVGNAVSGRVTFGLGWPSGSAPWRGVRVAASASAPPRAVGARGGLAGLLAGFCDGGQPGRRPVPRAARRRRCGCWSSGGRAGRRRAARGCGAAHRRALPVLRHPAVLDGGTALLPLVLAAAGWACTPKRVAPGAGVLQCGLRRRGAAVWLVPTPIGANVVRLSLLLRRCGPDCGGGRRPLVDLAGRAAVRSTRGRARPGRRDPSPPPATRSFIAGQDVARLRLRGRPSMPTCGPWSRSWTRGAPSRVGSRWCRAGATGRPARWRRTSTWPEAGTARQTSPATRCSIDDENPFGASQYRRWLQPLGRALRRAALLDARLRRPARAAPGPRRTPVPAARSGPTQTGRSTRSRPAPMASAPAAIGSGTPRASRCGCRSPVRPYCGSHGHRG